MDDADFEALQQELCRDEIGRLEKHFNTGSDPGAVLHAIFLCFQHRVEIPQWAQDGFRKAYRKGLHGTLNTRSWNEVFGQPKTKAQMSRYLRDVNLLPTVGRMVAQREIGQSIGTQLFEQIAKTLGTNRDAVAKAYAGWKRWRRLHESAVEERLSTQKNSQNLPE
jgi:hypothetical protein